MAKTTIFSHHLAVLHFCQHHFVRYIKFIYDGHVQKCLFLLTLAHSPTEIIHHFFFQGQKELCLRSIFMAVIKHYNAVRHNNRKVHVDRFFSLLFQTSQQPWLHIYSKR